jgi:hypothetical protein
MPAFQLSKSTFQRGVKCDKNLYLYKHHYNLKDPVSAEQQALFDSGHKIGLLAQQLFPGGIDASPSHYRKMEESVEKTRELIAAGHTIIYEATFLYDEVIAALDILVKDERGWKGYEVKSSSKLKETYKMDAAIQYYVISNSGVDLQDMSVVHLNNNYCRGEELEVSQLFSVVSVVDWIRSALPLLPDEIRRFKALLKDAKIPEVDIGPHCNKPYECDFQGHCWKHIPEYSVFDLARISNKAFDFYKEGKVHLNDLDAADPRLSEIQSFQVRAQQQGGTHIDRAGIEDFLNELEYPLYFLDFESFNTAIPPYSGTQPYQQIPFQYSLHIQQTPGGSQEHLEFLGSPGEDPRKALAEKLIQDCGQEGSVVVYNQKFEIGVLKKLGAFLPQYHHQLEEISDRIKDLMIPFQKGMYYDPAMRGSYSIKKVLPVMVPDNPYIKLGINNGVDASRIFLELTEGRFKGDFAAARKNLLDYCRTDTLAMVWILEKLRELVK